MIAAMKEVSISLLGIGGFLAFIGIMTLLYGVFDLAKDNQKSYKAGIIVIIISIIFVLVAAALH